MNTLSTTGARAFRLFPLPMVSMKRPGKDLLYIVSGCLVFVWGLNAIMIPEGLFSGGLAGIAILLTRFMVDADVGVVFFLLNLPLMLLGVKTISRRFILLTGFGMVLFSAAAAFWKPPSIELGDPFLAAVSSGVICGLCGGLILRSRGSAGA
jgi:uncharacterized membrane-anchored protein YitT (DUF2179 family)